MKTSEKYPLPYPQSIEDSYTLLAEQNPLQLKINQLQEDLSRLKSYNEELERDLGEAQRLLSKIFCQLNESELVVPF